MKTCTISAGVDRYRVSRETEYGSWLTPLKLDAVSFWVPVGILTDIQTTKTWDWDEAAKDSARVEVRDKESERWHERILESYRPDDDYPFRTHGVFSGSRYGYWEHCRLIAQDPDKWLVEEESDD